VSRYRLVVDDERLVESSGTSRHEPDLVIGADARASAERIADLYRRFGTACVDHLDDEFSFAIWDASRRTLFAARDHFGVRPLFHATAGTTTIVANQIDAIRDSGRVSDRLDPLAIARFLAGGTEADPIETVFADIKRVPPGSMLVAGEMRSWFGVGAAGGHTEADPIARFTELFDAAVAKRAPGQTVAVLMSGGLDSTAVAVSARSAGRDVHAYTLRGPRDDEVRYAAIVAKKWGMEHHVIDRADFPPFGGWDSLDRDEPYDDPFAAPFLAAIRDASRHTATMLTGHGGDALLRTTSDYLVDLVRRGRVLRAGTEVARHVSRTGRLPHLGIRGALRRRLGMKTFDPQLPPWLRADLRELLADEFPRERPATHPTRPNAQRAMTIPDWSLLFEVFHPAQTGIAVTFGYPFFDRDLVDLAFSLPPLPWFTNKYLLREAMRERLPREVVKRPKAPLPPRLPLDRQVVERLIGIAECEPALDAFINKAVLFEALRRSEVTSGSEHARFLPICLAIWLGRLRAKQTEMDRSDDAENEKALPGPETAHLR
jgi:asparagine synthase (glutamine-hydrolysing)